MARTKPGMWMTPAVGWVGLITTGALLCGCGPPRDSRPPPDRRPQAVAAPATARSSAGTAGARQTPLPFERAPEERSRYHVILKQTGGGLQLLETPSTIYVQRTLRGRYQEYLEPPVYALDANGLRPDPSFLDGIDLDKPHPFVGNPSWTADGIVLFRPTGDDGELQRLLVATFQYAHDDPVETIYVRKGTRWMATRLADEEDRYIPGYHRGSPSDHSLKWREGTRLFWLGGDDQHRFVLQGAKPGAPVVVPKRPPRPGGDCPECYGAVCGFFESAVVDGMLIVAGRDCHGRLTVERWPAGERRALVEHLPGAAKPLDRTGGPSGRPALALFGNRASELFLVATAQGASDDVQRLYVARFDGRSWSDISPPIGERPRQPDGDRWGVRYRGADLWLTGDDEFWRYARHGDATWLSVDGADASRATLELLSDGSVWTIDEGQARRLEDGRLKPVLLPAYLQNGGYENRYHAVRIVPLRATGEVIIHAVEDPNADVPGRINVLLRAKAPATAGDAEPP